MPRLWLFEVADVLGREDPLCAGPIMDELPGYRFEEAYFRKVGRRGGVALLRDFIPA